MTTPSSDGSNLPTNWGRWGDDDELGTLNLVTDEARARGVAEATTGRVVSLAHPVTPVPLAGLVPAGDTPMPSGVLQAMNVTGSPARALTDTLVVNTHHQRNTHIDALSHIITATASTRGSRSRTPRGSVLCATARPRPSPRGSPRAACSSTSRRTAA